MAINPKKSFLGRWHITYMEEWDQDYVDLVVPGFITFKSDNSGEFQFGTVRGFMDWRLEKTNRESRVEFSWEGENDSDPGCGRGWAKIEQEQLVGHIYIHMSDDSEFVAEKIK